MHVVFKKHMHPLSNLSKRGSSSLDYMYLTEVETDIQNGPRKQNSSGKAIFLAACGQVGGGCRGGCACLDFQVFNVTITMPTSNGCSSKLSLRAMIITCRAC